MRALLFLLFLPHSLSLSLQSSSSSASFSLSSNSAPYSSETFSSPVSSLSSKNISSSWAYFFLWTNFWTYFFSFSLHFFFENCCCFEIASSGFEWKKVYIYFFVSRVFLLFLFQKNVLVFFCGFFLFSVSTTRSWLS